MLKLLIKIWFLLILLPTLSQAQLLDDWGGFKNSLQQRGISTEAVLTSDFLYSAAGGIKQDGTILGNFDLTFALDTAEADWWANGTFFVYFLGDFNTNGFMTEILGDLQTSSNIEADETFRLFEFWYEHQFIDQGYSLLFGLHDFNSEFAVLEYAGLFINSSFGISPDISQNGPSIFPSAALGLRLKTESDKSGYLMIALYDGVPDDSGDAPRTTVILKEKHGVFAALELGFAEEDKDQAGYCKLAIGGWIHTAEVENFNGQVHDFNRGFYLIGEKNLYTEKDGTQGLGAFIQLGMADKDLNQISNYWGLGLHYTGAFSGRNKDILGLAIAQALVADKYIEYSHNSLGIDVDHHETTIELSYRSVLTPWLVMQPDIQYVIHPSMDSSIDHALQLGLRVEIVF